MGKSEEALKPCPFCGGKPNVVQGECTGGYWIECEDCLSSTRVGNKREIFKLWSERQVSENTATGFDFEKELTRHLNRLREEIAEDVAKEIQKLIDSKQRKEESEDA